MTSIMCWLRRLLADISPKAQRIPSEILDFPQPFGPTTAVIPGSNSTRVLSAKDLNPTISRRFNRTALEYQFVPNKANPPLRMGVVNRFLTRGRLRDDEFGNGFA